MDHSLLIHSPADCSQPSVLLGTEQVILKFPTSAFPLHTHPVPHLDVEELSRAHLTLAPGLVQSWANTRVSASWMILPKEHWSLNPRGRYVSSLGSRALPPPPGSPPPWSSVATVSL